MEKAGVGSWDCEIAKQASKWIGCAKISFRGRKLLRSFLQLRPKKAFSEREQNFYNQFVPRVQFGFCFCFYVSTPTSFVLIIFLLLLSFSSMFVLTSNSHIISVSLLVRTKYWSGLFCQSSWLVVFSNWLVILESSSVSSSVSSVSSSSSSSSSSCCRLTTISWPLCGCFFFFLFLFLSHLTISWLRVVPREMAETNFCQIHHT